MKKRNPFIAYVLIIIGVFFLLRQLKIPILTNFYSWQTILIVIGGGLLFYSFLKDNGKNLFSGTLLFGLGIHFYGMEHYHFWSHHWGMFPLIIGIAYFVRAFKTKKGFLVGSLLILLSVFMIYSTSFHTYLYWLDDVIDLIKQYWAILLILLGIYMLMRKK